MGYIYHRKYNYSVACAGSNTASSNCAYDICPAGWRLPTRLELEAIANIYTTPAAMTASPFLGVYSGGEIAYDGGSLGMVKDVGHYWSSTPYDSRNAYLLMFGTFNNNSFVSVNNDFNYYLNSIRCVLK